MEERNNNIDPNESTPSEINEKVSAEATSDETVAEQEIIFPVASTEKEPVEKTVYAYRWSYTSQYEADKNAKKRSGLKGTVTFCAIMGGAFALAIATLLVSLIIGLFPASTVGGNTTILNTETDLVALYEACVPSYVAISTTTESGISGAGSGFVLTADGYIATNYHVVDNAQSISVILTDGTKLSAEYVAGDSLNDIAVIKISGKKLTPAKIGNSDALKVGQRVMAIGTPYSIQYRGTMTSGYVSALNRKYQQKNENGTVNRVITMLQTDTSVNPGNSGGPLFNMNGEVVGIVTMKIAVTGYEGMGFAIPISGVIDMLNDIVKNGKLTISNGGSAREGASLGISGFDVEENTEYLLSGDYHYVVKTDDEGNKIVSYISALGVELQIPLDDEELLERYSISDYTLYTAPATGVRVMSVTEGFDVAEKLQENDIILTADGIACNPMEALREYIAECLVGDVLELEVFRDGQTISVSVTLGRSADME